MKFISVLISVFTALGKVRDFLAVIAKANKDLEIKAQENPCSNYDIEALSDEEKEYIEMDLLLGVADLHSSEAVAAAEASVSGFRPTVDVDYDDDDGGNFDENTFFKDNTRSAEHGTDLEPSREAKPNKRAKVVMLD
ncbi:hypothetical protein KSP39_PZI010251 [Platanthera zijinensis]|uniref:Uncharacterized protein n=1 Tax=Platanthera zijinensis TaxID=2320716 RepID=A0AAP0BKI6_9ASPA